MIESQVHGLFPIPITQHKLNRAITPEELEFFLALERRRTYLNAASIEDHILDEAPLAGIRTFLEECIATYFQVVYDPSTNIYPYITQSWATFTEKGEQHHKHYHSNSMVSGVLYIQTAEDDRITFYSNRAEWIKITPSKYTVLNSGSWSFPAVVGEALLFPSWLEHSTIIHNSDTLRISLAFNTFIKGQIGERFEKTELHI